MTSRLPLRPATVYGATHETGRAEGRTRHRAARRGRRGGRPGLSPVHANERTAGSPLSPGPAGRTSVLRTALPLDGRGARRGGSVRGLEGRLRSRPRDAAAVPCDHARDRTGRGEKV